MTLQELIPPVFEVCLIPLLGVLTAYLVTYIRIQIQQLKEKADNETSKKYLTMLEKTITACVLTTQQTYVDSLKKAGSFDAEAQKVAFDNTRQAVVNILSNDAKEYLSAAYGDLEQLIVQKIEAEVYKSK